MFFKKKKKDNDFEKMIKEFENTKAIQERLLYYGGQEIEKHYKKER